MDVFTLAAKLQLDSKGFESGLKKNEGVFKSFGSKFKTVMSTLGKVSAAGLGAGIAAVSGLTKQIVEAYGSYEQLVGGVETLFKTSAGTVQEYADRAYKTAGLSANQYMETVTSFSASLLQGLNGDTARAAEIADKAIIDMSDNANKMGTAIEAIQNAYNGFAKGNFTMLDNLKLGYGGTKTEMERLLADAEALTGIKYDINNFADIIEAIHTIQDEIGITGTTAKEADSTIQGSLSSMQSAWENLIIEFGKGNGDIKGKIDILVETAETAFHNLMPVVENALSGIATFVEQIAPIIAAKLPGIVADIGPKLVSAAATLAGGVIAALPALISAIFTAITSVDWVGIGTTVFNMISSSFAGIAQWASDTFNLAVAAIAEIDWAKVGTDILDFIVSGFVAIGTWFTNIFNGAVAAIKGISWADVSSFIENAIAGAGSVLAGIATTIKGFFDTAFADIKGITWSDIASTIDTAVTGAGSVLQGISNGIKSFFDTAFADIKGITWSDIGTTIDTAITGAAGGLSGIVANITQFFNDASANIQAIDWESVGSFIKTKVQDGIRAIGNWLKERFESAKTRIESIEWGVLGESILNFITQAFIAIDDLFKGFFEDAYKAILSINWLELGQLILKLIQNGLKTIVSWFTKRLEAAKSAIEHINWTELGENIWKFISDAFANVISFFHDTFFNASADVENQIDWAALGKAIWNLIKAAFVGVGDLLKGFFKPAITKISGMNWASVGTNILDAIGNAFIGIGDWITEKFKPVTDFFDTLPTTVTNAFDAVEQAWETTATFFTVTIPAAWESVRLTAETVWGEISGFVTGAFDAVKTAWEGVKLFFTKFIPLEWNNFKQKADEIFGAIGGFIAIGFGVVVTVWETVKSFFTTTIPNAWKTLKEKADEFFGGIGSVVSSVFGVIGSILQGAGEIIGGLVTSITGWFAQIKENDEKLKAALEQGIDLKPLEEGETVYQRFAETLRAANEAIEEDMPVEVEADTSDLDEAEVDVTGLINLMNALQDSGKQKTTITTDVITNYITTGDPSLSAFKPSGHTGGTGKTLTLKESTKTAYINARSMFGGTILRNATMFGVDSQGHPQIGGGEGPEAVVGVNSLGQMITDAVTNAVNGAFAVIASAGSGDGSAQVIEAVDRAGSLNRWRLRIVDEDIVTAVGDVVARVHNAAEYLGNVISLTAAQNDTLVMGAVSNAANSAAAEENEVAAAVDRAGSLNRWRLRIVDEDIVKALGDTTARVHNAAEYLGVLLNNPTGMAAVLEGLFDRLIYENQDIEISITSAEWHMRIKLNEVSQEIRDTVRATANNAAMQRDELADRIAERLGEKLDTLVETIRTSPTYVQLDSGALVGELAPAMDTELNRLADWKGGGRA